MFGGCFKNGTPIKVGILFFETPPYFLVFKKNKLILVVFKTPPIFLVFFHVGPYSGKTHSLELYPPLYFIKEMSKYWHESRVFFSQFWDVAEVAIIHKMI
jgi:hypothetical protein